MENKIKNIPETAPRMYEHLSDDKLRNRLRDARAYQKQCWEHGNPQPETRHAIADVKALEEEMSVRKLIE